MSELRKLEEQLETNKAQIAKGALVDKLLADHDFRKIILDDFCRDEVVRNMNLSGDPAMTDPNIRADATDMARAGGHLKRYLSAQRGMALAASNQMVDLEAAIEELRAEEGAE